MSFKTVKLQLEGGNATPGPPVGTSLGSTGVNTRDFCMQFNNLTQAKKGKILRTHVLVFPDKKFKIIIKGQPTSTLIKQAANVEKGSSTPKRIKVGSITQEALKKIVQEASDNLQGFTQEAKCNIIAGTARSMGIEVIP